MSLPSYRSSEPLYVLILRNHSEAEQLLKSWIKINKIEHAAVSGNRMTLHDQHSFEQFKLTWTHDVSNLTIWDTWLRRHIYLD